MIEDEDEQCWECGDLLDEENCDGEGLCDDCRSIAEDEDSSLYDNLSDEAKQAGGT